MPLGFQWGGLYINYRCNSDESLHRVVFQSAVNGNKMLAIDFIRRNALFMPQLEPYFSERGHYTTLMKTDSRLDEQFKIVLTFSLSFLSCVSVRRVKYMTVVFFFQSKRMSLHYSVDLMLGQI